MDKSAKYKHRNTMHYYVCHSNLDIKIEDRLIIGNFGNKGQIVTRSPFSSLISRKKKKYSQGLGGFTWDKLPW